MFCWGLGWVTRSCLKGARARKGRRHIVTFLRQEYFTLVSCRTFMYQLKYHHQNRDYHIFYCHHRKAYNNKGIILRSGQSGLLGFELELGLKGVVSGEGPKHLPP